MSTDPWNEIIEDYKRARSVFWHTHELNATPYKDQDADFYLLRAYYNAQRCNVINHLWFGRILYMLAENSYYICSHYDIFKKYATPALHEFEQAIECGESPTDKEINDARALYERLKLEYDHDQASIFDEEVSKLFEGDPLPDDFEIYDQKPIAFEIHEDSASLTFEHEQILVIFHFSDIYEINISTDPVTDYIQNFSCYKDMNQILFDIGFYKIRCTNIRVEIRLNPLSQN